MRTVRDMVKNDELETPPEAIDPLLPYLPKWVDGHTNEQLIIWEMCPGSGAMVDYLIENEYSITRMYPQSRNSLLFVPEYRWDMIVTNPPWSKKHLFLERCVELNKPFALLLPVRTLGVRRCQVWLDDVDVLFLKRRVDFTGGGAPYEACAWFTRSLLPDRMVFET